MAKNNFLLLSLDDSQINAVANVVSNKSCKMILDFLAEKDATESDIAKELKSPISTIHYNLKQLMQAGLVKADEFHYSEKGREVLHYKLANKYIIIAPQKEKGLKSILKNILPVTLVTAAIAGIIQLVPKLSQKEAPMAALRAADSAGSFAMKAAEIAPSSEPAIALWFLIGALSAVAVYVIIAFIKKR